MESYEELKRNPINVFGDDGINQLLHGQIKIIYQNCELLKEDISDLQVTTKEVITKIKNYDIPNKFIKIEKTINNVKLGNDKNENDIDILKKMYNDSIININDINSKYYNTLKIIDEIVDKLKIENTNFNLLKDLEHKFNDKSKNIENKINDLENSLSAVILTNNDLDNKLNNLNNNMFDIIIENQNCKEESKFRINKNYIHTLELIKKININILEKNIDISEQKKIIKIISEKNNFLIKLNYFFIAFCFGLIGILYLKKYFGFSL